MATTSLTSVENSADSRGLGRALVGWHDPVPPWWGARGPVGTAEWPRVWSRLSGHRGCRESIPVPRSALGLGGSPRRGGQAGLAGFRRGRRGRIHRAVGVNKAVHEGSDVLPHPRPCVLPHHGMAQTPSSRRGGRPWILSARRCALAPHPILALHLSREPFQCILEAADCLAFVLGGRPGRWLSATLQRFSEATRHVALLPACDWGGCGLVLH